MCKVIAAGMQGTVRIWTKEGRNYIIPKPFSGKPYSVKDEYKAKGHADPAKDIKSLMIQDKASIFLYGVSLLKPNAKVNLIEKNTQ